MKLSAIPLGTTFLSSNLKACLLAGIIGVSASTGAIATATNTSLISSTFDTVSKPVEDFLNKNISPHLKSVYAGAKKIGDKLESWTSDAYSNKETTLKWIKDNFNPSSLKSGLQKIITQTKEWGNGGKDALKSAYEAGKTTLLPFLSDSSKVRDLLYHGSEITNVLKAFATLLTASALSSATGGAGGGGSDDEDDLDEEEISANAPALSKFWQLVTHKDFSKIVSSVWDLVTENLPIVKQLSKEEVSKIINFVLNQPDQVESRISEMKNPKEGKQDEASGKWGDYKTPQNFLKALIPPPNLIEELMQALTTIVGSDLKDFISDPNKTISVDKIKSVLPICTNSDSSTKSQDSICTNGGTLTEFLTKFLQPIATAPAQE